MKLHRIPNWMRGSLDPDLIVGPRYLMRWYLIPRNRLLNIYLHKYEHSDDDRALHDHPWRSFSFLFRGKLFEVEDINQRNVPPEKLSILSGRFLSAPQIRVRSGEYAHRLVLLTDTAWTLFITGPVYRNWGFYCKSGWVPHEQYIENLESRELLLSGDSVISRLGRGCGDE